jgi:hypothetical protein
MRFIYILTAINALIWGTLIVMGRSGISSITAQHVKGYPASGQITYYLYIPIIVFLVVLSSFALSLRRRFGCFIIAIQVVAFLIFFPYMLAYTGGI